MTATVQKQDPNTQKVHYLLAQNTKHNMQILGAIPYINLQNYT